MCELLRSRRLQALKHSAQLPALIKAASTSRIVRAHRQSAHHSHSKMKHNKASLPSAALLLLASLAGGAVQQGHRVAEGGVTTAVGGRVAKPQWASFETDETAHSTQQTTTFTSQQAAISSSSHRSTASEQHNAHGHLRGTASGPAERTSPAHPSSLHAYRSLFLGPGYVQQLDDGDAWSGVCVVDQHRADDSNVTMLASSAIAGDGAAEWSQVPSLDADGGVGAASSSNKQDQQEQLQQRRRSVLDVMSSSALQMCYDNGAGDALANCSMKVVVTGAINNGESDGTGRLVYDLSSAPSMGKPGDDFTVITAPDTLTVTIAQTAINLIYPLTYYRDYNDRPYEIMLGPWCRCGRWIGDRV